MTGKVNEVNLTAPTTKLFCLLVLFYFNHETADRRGDNACVTSVWFLMWNSSLTVHWQIPEFQSFVKKAQEPPPPGHPAISTSYDGMEMISLCFVWTALVQVSRHLWNVCKEKREERRQKGQKNRWPRQWQPPASQKPEVNPDQSPQTSWRTRAQRGGKRETR